RFFFLRTNMGAKVDIFGLRHPAPPNYFYNCLIFIPRYLMAQNVMKSGVPYGSEIFLRHLVNHIEKMRIFAFLCKYCRNEVHHRGNRCPLQGAGGTDRDRFRLH
ncbi:MAG: hypothetical protein J6S82_00020, partial [Bacteroidales bacterium]|nr:hypothetical protein [Bacteroidales bacterium]